MGSLGFRVWGHGARKAIHPMRKAWLPATEVSYSIQVSGLTSTEVVGIVNQYKAFYMPKFLLPEGTGEAIPLPSFDEKKGPRQSKG